MDKFLQSERTCVEDIFYPPPSKNSNGTLQNKERVSRIYSTFFFFLQEAEKLSCKHGASFCFQLFFPPLTCKGSVNGNTSREQSNAGQEENKDDAKESELKWARSS